MTEKDLIIQELRRENAELRTRMPIVRCKDCKYFKTPLCQNENNHDNWFCADGERKDGDGNG